MKKSILKNVAILTLALFGLGIIGNNAFADGPDEPEKEGPGEGGGGGGGSIYCYWVQIAHCPNFTWVMVDCQETIYQQGYEQCSPCGSRETWPL